jgi:O-antigen ligase
MDTMTRNKIIFIVNCILLFGALTTVAALNRDRDFELRGYVDATRDADLPWRIPRLGVNAELTQYNNSELSLQLNWMQRAHITWVRQFIRWNEIEATEGEYNWENIDPIIEAFRIQPHLSLVPVLVNAPGWAKHPLAQDTPTAPPQHSTDFAQFAEQFAERYGDVIHYYQIWDEPNLQYMWGGLEPRTADYVDLLSNAYQAIHRADHDAMVIAAALAPTTETGPQNVSDLVFLEDMYAYGAQQYMDAVAAKPYGFDRSPYDREIHSDILSFSRIVALREIMVQHGDTSKTLWASEWGWNSLPSDWQGSASIWGAVSQEDQIQFVNSAMQRAEQEWPWLGGMILQHWQPQTTLNDPHWGFAIIGQDNQPSALFDALTQRSNQSVASNGLYPAQNPFAKYSGVWTFGSLGADIGWVQDSRLAFEFSGQNVALQVRQDNYVAYLYATIDGHPPNQLPQDNVGNAYLVLSSASQKPEEHLIVLAEGLDPGLHTLEVTVDRGWDRWALIGFAVSDTNRALPYQQQITIAWLCVGLATIGLFINRQSVTELVPKRLRTLFASMGQATQIIVALTASLALLAGMLLTWGNDIPRVIRRDPVPLIGAILSSGLIWLEPNVILMVLALGILFVIIYHHIYIGLGFTLFWSPFFLFPVELYQFAFPLAEVILLLTFCAWLLRYVRKFAYHQQTTVSQYKIKWNISEIARHIQWIDWCVIMWGGLAFLSLSWAEWRSPAITELRVIFLEPILFYLIFRTEKLTRKEIVAILDLFLIAGVLVAGIGLIQFLRGEAIITAEAGARRLASVYGSPNNVALLLGRVLPFLFAFTLIKVDSKRRALAACALLMALVAFALTQSAGGLFLGLPAMLTVTLVLSLGKRSKIFVIILLAILAIGFAFSLQNPRFARLLDFSSGTNFYRLRVWESALDVIHDHPLTGLGLDQFLYAFRGHYIRPDAWQEPNLSHPHNIVLDFWVRLGAGGVIVLLGFLVGFWQKVKNIWPLLSQDDLYTKAIVVGAIGSMVNLVAHGLVDNSVYVQDLSYIFVFLLILVQIPRTWLTLSRE